jgi:6-phosphogluconate dehydrogenase
MAALSAMRMVEVMRAVAVFPDRRSIEIVTRARGTRRFESTANAARRPRRRAMGDVKRELGMVGLGRMGGGLALQARDKGMAVVGHDPAGLRPELVHAGVVPARTLGELRSVLSAPRAVFLYVPAGPTVDAVIEELELHLEPGDVIVDGGNSYWGDSIRRHERLAGRGLAFVDLGTSGGVEGARHGACFMAGGDRDGVQRIAPVLVDLAVEGGYVHAGPAGSGHFAKLVHNGIEFGMLEAIAEGVDLLERFRDRIDVPAILAAWLHGSVIRGWLVELMHERYVAEGGLSRVPPLVEDTGEVNWLVADALRLEAPIPVIAQSVMQLFASRDDRKTWARAIAMMRHAFGGHPYGASATVAEERRRGQVGGTIRDDERG